MQEGPSSGVHDSARLFMGRPWLSAAGHGYTVRAQWPEAWSTGARETMSANKGHGSTLQHLSLDGALSLAYCG